jgi:putative Mg2+ transporter-C (MgtC) family protein
MSGADAGHLAVAVALTYALGFERDLRGAPTGDRVFALIGAGAGVVGIIAAHGAPNALAGAITGIGFIGGGLLYRRQTTGKEQVLMGITTAAAIFAAAGIGAAAGQGRLLVATAATLLALFVLEIRHIKVLSYLDGRRYAGRFGSEYSGTEDETDPHLPIPGIRLVGGHELDAERHQRDRDQLEVGQSQRDPDDRQAEHDTAGQVPEREPPADQDDPQDVPDHRADAGVPLQRDLPAERPQHIAGDPPGGDPERDRDDQDETDASGQEVEDGHPPAAQDQPDDVEDRPHNRVLPGRTHLKLIKQGGRRRRHFGHGPLKRLCVMPGRGPEPADLAHVLKRGGPDVLVGDPLGVRRAQCLNAAAHELTIPVTQVLLL